MSPLPPESGQMADIAECPLRAISGLMHRNIPDRYSITSSASSSQMRDDIADEAIIMAAYRLRAAHPTAN